MHRGIFSTDRRNPAHPSVPRRRTAENVSNCLRLTPLRLARVLPLGVASITCFEQLSFRSCWRWQ